MESLNKSTNQEESFKSRNGEVRNRTSKNHWVMVETAEDALAEGQTTEMLISQTSQNQTIENKQRMEDEFKTLLQETSILRKELDSAKSEIEKLKNKSNITQKCRIEFELDFPNNEAKAEVLKLVGGLPDITSITMEGKRLSLKSIDIDPLALSDKLKNICDAKLVRFYITQMKKEEKKEEKKIDGPYPYPRGPMYPNYPQMSTENYGATTMRMSHFSLKEAGTIFLAVFLSLLLLRLAPYANVLIRSGA